MLLGQATIRLRHYGWETSMEGSLQRQKNKVEEIQLANLWSQEARKQPDSDDFILWWLSISSKHLRLILGGDPFKVVVSLLQSR